MLARRKISIGGIAVAILIFAILGLFFFFVKNVFPPITTGTGEKESSGIGVIAADQGTIDKYQAVVDYLNTYSGDQWYLVPQKDYGSFISQMRSGQIKAGFMGSTVAYRLMRDGVAKPLVRGESQGIADYYGYIFTRRDSGLGKIEDLAGKRFAYVDVYTSAGYFFPRALLVSKGLDPENFFRVASFLGSHDKAILAVLNGDYDGGAAKDSAWRKLVGQDPRIEKELQIIAKEGPFPEQTFMVQTEIYARETQKLRGLFLNMNTTADGKHYLAKFGADRFIVTEEKDFQKAKELYRD